MAYRNLQNVKLTNASSAKYGSPEKCTYSCIHENKEKSNNEESFKQWLHKFNTRKLTQRNEEKNNKCQSNEITDKGIPKENSSTDENPSKNNDYECLVACSPCFSIYAKIDCIKECLIRENDNEASIDQKRDSQSNDDQENASQSNDDQENASQSNDDQENDSQSNDNEENSPKLSLRERFSKKPYEVIYFVTLPF
ncbi:Plasmodium exported protein, unknown function [Plasmodium gallinaceum]|uniref:Uncharacterized protein n=1 Tax=Plasmodium gallinaceum TaxID=5849 RepID=A0A1J1GMV6_PLAGA|nr:Plasmodium exported protein, unknown function [Plasmodium gallinaceum]CRG93597.1 Plasmodium exported protein, unknown function [Plasmodium gallinaceum]